MKNFFKAGTPTGQIALATRRVGTLILLLLVALYWQLPGAFADGGCREWQLDKTGTHPDLVQSPGDHGSLAHRMLDCFRASPRRRG